MFKYLILMLSLVLSLEANAQGSCKYARSDLKALSCVIFMESRGSTMLDKHAVAFVALNRSQSSKYPSSIRKVVYQKGQFSWTNLPNTLLIPKERKAWIEATEIAENILNGEVDDPTNGAIYFSKKRMKYMKRITLKTGDHYYGT